MKISNTIPDQFEGNEAYMNIVQRVSVRRFTEEAVTDDQLSAILHAAMSAPSGVNRQPWEFVVIDDKRLLQELSEALPYAKMVSQAGVALIVSGNRNRFLEGEDSELWQQDLSAVSENILLASHAIGLGGVWTCIFPHEERIAPVRKILEIPDALIPFNLIPIGYPKADHAPINKWNPDRIHFNSFREE
ncbi:MAG: nitroreductase family protein [Muribaculaceae bacterium]|nr:nitroreductase family protein [Muribaculaceae bacterium]